MARPRNEDQSVKMVCDIGILRAGILPSVTVPVHRGDEFEVTRKEADALAMFGYAIELPSA